MSSQTHIEVQREIDRAKSSPSGLKDLRMDVILSLVAKNAARRDADFALVNMPDVPDENFSVDQSVQATRSWAENDWEDTTGMGKDFFEPLLNDLLWLGNSLELDELPFARKFLPLAKEYYWAGIRDEVEREFNQRKPQNDNDDETFSFAM